LIIEKICDDRKLKLIIEGINLTSKISNDKGISEIDFIENVRLMIQIFYTRKKKEKNLPIYN